MGFNSAFKGLIKANGNNLQCLKMIRAAPHHRSNHRLRI